MDVLILIMILVAIAGTVLIVGLALTAWSGSVPGTADLEATARARVQLHQAWDRLKTFEARCKISSVKRETQRALRRLDEM